jgi:hypothetical protein
MNSENQKMETIKINNEKIIIIIPKMKDVYKNLTLPTQI